MVAGTRRYRKNTAMPTHQRWNPYHLLPWTAVCNTGRSKAAASFSCPCTTMPTWVVTTEVAVCCCLLVALLAATHHVQVAGNHTFSRVSKPAQHIQG